MTAREYINQVNNGTATKSYAEFVTDLSLALVAGEISQGYYLDEVYLLALSADWRLTSKP